MWKKRRETVEPLEKYREYKLIPQFWAWVLLFAVSASLIGWALWIHSLVPHAERHWDYGQRAFTPAESIYSTSVVPRDMPPREQMPRLPEAQPLRRPPAPAREGGPP